MVPRDGPAAPKSNLETREDGADTMACSDSCLARDAYTKRPWIFLDATLSRDVSQGTGYSLTQSLTKGL